MGRHASKSKAKGYPKGISVSIQELVDNGFAEEVVEDEEPKNGHYLQSHAVYREDHDKTKTRCVLNGAAIVESNNLLPNTKFGKQIDWKKS